MIAVCDIGGSKGDWGFIHPDNKIVLAETAGFNPFIHDSNLFVDQLISAFKDIPLQEVKKVYYYGTGCREESSKEKVRRFLSLVFTGAVLEVDIDLLASARATCGHHKGIACILGTGANSGLYDGKYIEDNIPTLGYLAGDEGSGAHLGKLLIRSYFYREMPQDIREEFEIFFPGKHEKILQGLYTNPPANQFLASFTQFVSKHLSHPFTQKILDQNFQAFIDTQLSKYPGYQTLPANFVGSIAYYFQNQLIKCLEKNKIKAGTIISKPLQNLIQYHIEDENN